MTMDREELLGLFESLCDGAITPAQHERLQSQLAAEPAARRLYFDYLDVRLLLRQWQRASAGEPPSSSAHAPAKVVSAPIVIPTSAPLDAPLSSIYSPLGGFVFSYAAAVIIVGIGLLIGWAYQVSNPRSNREEVVKVLPQPAPANLRPKPEMVYVGRVTGMVDCRWADPKTATTCYAYVPLGRKYVLASGLLKITYDSGARVILQGPCVYEVSSRTSGYLSLGRLTAKVETTAESGGAKAEKRTQGNSASFVVCTPTAKITDLGTWFGVEVDRSGVSKAHVYQGKVEMRAVGRGDSMPISLDENESGRVEISRGGVVAVVRQKGQKSALVREMPKPVPFVLFNTGAGLKELDPDPHWQIIARSDDKNFKPRPSRVRVAGANALENDPAHSQWISLIGEDVRLPEDVVYVFRTTFDLTGMLPSTAVLRGRFIADDRVVAIRLNGRRVMTPLQHDGEPFVEWTKFNATAGFVKGTNVLEVDVLNAGPFTSPTERRTAKSRMSCRMELEGEACLDPGLEGDDVSDKASPVPDHENKKAATESKGPEQDRAGRAKKRTPPADTRSARRPNESTDVECSQLQAWQISRPSFRSFTLRMAT